MDYRIEQDAQTGNGNEIARRVVIISEHATLPEARKAVATLPPGEYSITHVVNARVTVALPPPTVKVDFGAPSIQRTRTAAPKGNGKGKGKHASAMA